MKGIVLVSLLMPWAQGQGLHGYIGYSAAPPPAEGELDYSAGMGFYSAVWPLIDEPFLHGRGLDTRRGTMNGGAMEVNTVPNLTERSKHDTVYSKIPQLSFPVDEHGKAVLVQDVTYYSKAALFDAFEAWRNGGPACTGAFEAAGAHVAKLTPRNFAFKQDGLPITGVQDVIESRAFDDHSWGLQWKGTNLAEPGHLPQYFKQVKDSRVAVAAHDVPEETHLTQRSFPQAKRGAPFVSPSKGATRTRQQTHAREARRWLHRHLPLVPLHRPAFLPTLHLEPS